MLLFSQQLSPFAAQKGSAWWRNSHTSLPAEDLVLVVLGRECGHGRLPSLVCCCVPAGRGSRGSFDALRIHAVAACFWIRTGRIVRAESDLWPEIWGVAPGAGLNDTIDGDTVSSSGATPVGRFWKVSGRHSGHKVRCTGTRCGRRQWAGFVVRQFGAPLL